MPFEKSADTRQTQTTLLHKIADMSQTQTDCRQSCLFNSGDKLIIMMKKSLINTILLRLWLYKYNNEIHCLRFLFVTFSKFSAAFMNCGLPSLSFVTKPSKFSRLRTSSIDVRNRFVPDVDLVTNPPITRSSFSSMSKYISHASENRCKISDMKRKCYHTFDRFRKTPTNRTITPYLQWLDMVSLTLFNHLDCRSVVS